MIDREKVIQKLAKSLEQMRANRICIEDVIQLEEDAYDALALLRDTTNPKGGSCSTCIHEYEPGSDYCLTHQKCKVCGICSGYEGGDGDD